MELGFDIDFDQVAPALFVGAHPTSCEAIDRLKKATGMTAVLNLQTDEDRQAWRQDWPALDSHYRRSGVEVRRVPIRDFDSRDLVQRLPDGVVVLNELLEAGHTVYVHCTAGVWRAPTVVIAYLHWCEGWDLEKALVHVKRHRPCSPSLETLRAASRDVRNGPHPPGRTGSTDRR